MEERAKEEEVKRKNCAQDTTKLIQKYEFIINYSNDIDIVRHV